MQDNPVSTPARDATNKPGLLLVDDDPLITESLGLVLADEYDVVTVDTRKQVVHLLNSLEVFPSIALVDLGLPPKPHSPQEGFNLIHDLLGYNRDIKILVLSGQSDKANIQHALTLGAVDFIPKPCDISLLKTRLHHQLMMLDAERASRKTEKSGELLLGESPAIETLRNQIQQFADNPFPVLIEGESGSGKELVAELLHMQSSRNSAPYLTINCASFTAELLESQLFGHCKGAFTGATTDKAGFFEEANEGSLFLDEIGELPVDLQSKLLRVLENGEFYRVGETRNRKSSARIIAATNRDLKEAVRKGKFRQDLYHRLSVLSIYVPPLYEREQDCLIILDHLQKVYTGNRPFTLSNEAKQVLLEYPFPGNVRELRNIVIRLGAKYPGETIQADQIAAELEDTAVELEIDKNRHYHKNVKNELLNNEFNLDAHLEELEKQYINAALEISDGNLSKAARLLGVNRTTLYSRLDRFSDGEDD